MGRWTYYSPLWLGVLAVFLINERIRAGVPRWPEWQQWVLVAGVAVAVAVQLQVLLIGVQGAFAQVLPVPVGRSLRGRLAAVVGWLLIAWFVLAAVTTLFGLEAVNLPAMIVGGVALGVLAAAGACYAWGFPAAVRDFADSRSGLD